MDRINKLILTPFLAIAIMTGAAAFSPKARAASDDVCQGFPIKQRITRLGGPNAFAEGATMNSVADLQDLFNKYETDIRQVLETQGMSEVSDSLFEAVANGQGISEGIVNPGDTFEWMAWRKQGKPTTTSPTCLATSTYYDSFDIRVQTEDDNQITTHTFTAPKICLNLALVNVEKATKPAPEPAAEAPQYSDPSCSISASAYEVQATEPIEINVTGYWARDTGEGIQVEVVNSEGVTVASVPPPYPATVTLDKAGTYTLRGLATNEAGATATCETQVLAERKRRWTLRPFFAYVNPSNDDIQQSRVRPNGVLERSTLSFGGGAGAGISAEYHFTDLIGLEGAVIFAQLDSRFMLDLDEAW
ncbi:MAG: hypothetical protein OEU36_18505, partial [Gammaproteobacteria bacterium]|nr:hypothetical protein [Gammaproteobacteria bacterium]